MSRLPRPGEDANVWGDILNDFLSVSHMDDGTIRVSALPAPQVADGSITPAKLSQSYVPVSQKGATNGVATLDATGKVPMAQIPASAAVSDATTGSKGIVRLAGDLGGTADAPTVPGLITKYVKPAGGIPETDLDSNVQTKLNSGGSVGDATSSTKGLVQLAGDLGGTADAPTVPGLSSKVDSSAKGAPNGVASLDGTGKVPVAQLPAGLEPDATTTSKGIVQLAGDLGGTADVPTVPGLSTKANDSDVMHLMGNETVTGLKVFTSLIEIPGPPVKSTDATNKAYVDSLVPSGGVGDATTTTKGVVQLAGDLGGTADAPTVPGLSSKINSSEKGAPNGVATLNAQGRLSDSLAPPLILPYSVNGTVSATTGTMRMYNYSGANWTIVGVSASVGTAPTGASLIVDVKVNGTTIFTTQANRPTIAAGANTSGHVTNMDVTTVANNQYLTVDVAQVGSTIAGADLCVQVEVR